MEERYGFKPEFSPSAPPQHCTCNLSIPSLSYSNIQNPNNNYCYVHRPSNNNTNALYPSLNSSVFPLPQNVNNFHTFSEPPSFSRDTFHQSSPQNNIYNNQAYQWINGSTTYGTVPPSAVQGGIDVDGHPIYVGRAYHEGDLIPAKVMPSKNAAYVAYDGKEHAVENFQVLCRQQLEWVLCQGGQLPQGAIPGGHTSEGEPLYIGRVYHEGSHTIGKVHPSHGACYIPFDGKEIAYPECEVLVVKM